MERNRRRTVRASIRLTALTALAFVVMAGWLGGVSAQASEVSPPTDVEGPCGPNPCAPPTDVEGPCGPNPCAPPTEGGPCPVDVCHSGPVEGPCGPVPCGSVPVEGPCGPNPCAPPIEGPCPVDVCTGPPVYEVPPGPPPTVDDTEPPFGPPPFYDVDPPQSSPPIWNDGPVKGAPTLDGPANATPGRPSVSRTERLREAVARIGRLAGLGGSPLAGRIHDMRVPSPTRGG